MWCGLYLGQCMLLLQVRSEWKEVWLSVPVLDTLSRAARQHLARLSCTSLMCSWCHTVQFPEQKHKVSPFNSLFRSFMFYFDHFVVSGRVIVFESELLTLGFLLSIKQYFDLRIIHPFWQRGFTWAVDHCHVGPDWNIIEYRCLNFFPSSCNSLERNTIYKLFHEEEDCFGAGCCLNTCSSLHPHLLSELSYPHRRQ